MRRITSRTVTSGVLAVTALWLCGCAHSRGLHATKEREMTLGLVQRYVHEGMSAVEVLEALGSPNMVRRDSEGRESWVYDKVATETSHSESDTGVSGQVSGTGVAQNSLLLGAIGGRHNRSSGATATTQKTLTVIIKFDKNGQVETYSYHTSTF
ncbi:MAG TPA: hypothetical protein PLO62_02125 [Candidatus Hydrogenedentes bacterium]|nr:hypothetical protein [Candidatus Hydrogenedentota bacterium]